MVLVGSQWSVAAEEYIRSSMSWMRGMVSRGVGLVVVCRSVLKEHESKWESQLLSSLKIDLLTKLCAGWICKRAKCV